MSFYRFSIRQQSLETIWIRFMKISFSDSTNGQPGPPGVLVSLIKK